MAIPNVLYYSILAAWFLLIFLSTPIINKIGSLYYPVVIVMMGLVFCINPSSNLGTVKWDAKVDLPFNRVLVFIANHEFLTIILALVFSMAIFISLLSFKLWCNERNSKW